MKICKRIYVVATILFLLINPFLSDAYADGFKVINEDINSEVLSEGIKHTSIARFTTSGWLDINILEVDMEESNTDIDILYGSEGISQPSAVSSMANEAGAVAAVNSDFFDTKTGSPIGQIVSDGTLISAPPDKSHYGKLSSFNISSEGDISFEYWTYDFNVILPDGKILPIATFNKATNGQYLSLYDHNWGNTPGSNGNSNHVEVILSEDGTVIDVRQNMPSTTIPDGYYALVSGGDTAMQLSLLVPGDKVQINLTTNPEYRDLKLSVSGGTMLVKDGNIAPITHDPVPKPTARTSIGINKNEDKLFLVTVDGRNGSSMGLTEIEMAQLMLDIGSYNALNFDGGGSTTMAVRPLGEKTVVTVNSPSDGKERRVADAVGIFNEAKNGDIMGLKIKSPDKIFMGSYGSIEVLAYDEGYNPLNVDMGEVQFSVEGANGDFDRNRFEPSSSGKATITVKYKGISEKVDITILDKPIILKSNISEITTGYNKKTEVKIYGKDEKGYTALIPSDGIEWSVHGNPGDIKDGIFTSSPVDASGYITAQFEDVHLNIPVLVGSPAQKAEPPNNINLEEVDPYNKKIDVKNDMSSYNIFLYGNTDTNNLLQNLALSKAIDKANETSSLAVFMGKGSEKLNNLKIPYLALDVPGLYEFRNSSFIILDSSKGGLRTTDSQQWFTLKDFLNQAQGTNIFIVLPTPVWGSNGFTDQREAALLEKTLDDYRQETGKNIWILYQGNQNFYTALNNEIRYIGLSGTSDISKNDMTTMPYALIEVDKNEIYYQKDYLFK